MMTVQVFLQVFLSVNNKDLMTHSFWGMPPRLDIDCWGFFTHPKLRAGPIIYR
jgi:hypothetical protein